MFWLGSGLYLQSPAFGWRPDAVGSVAILGMMSASLAPWCGRAADRIGPRKTRVLAVAAAVLSWVVFASFRSSLIVLASGLGLLDLGSTVTDISNRTILYTCPKQVRTRLNAIYTVAMFAGGGLMSALIGPCWAFGGWSAICCLGGSASFLALLVALRASRSRA